MDYATRLDIEARCIRTLNRYAIAVGEQDPAGFADLFLPDAIWQRPGQPQMTGRAEIRAFMTALPASTLVRHVNGSARVDVDSADHARAISYTTVYNAENHQGGVAPMGGPDYVVEYRDQFRRSGEEWLIARRDTFLVLRANYAADLPGIPNPARR